MHLNTSGFLFDNAYAGPLLWGLLFVFDYACTLASARLYEEGVKQHLRFQGSFELTPYYQRDIDALRRVSPRFLLVLILLTTTLVALWLATRELGQPASYAVLLGALVLTQCGVHLRHVRNLFLFRNIQSAVIRGRIVFRRGFVLRASAAELYSLGGLWLLLFVVCQHWFFLGGVLGCLLIARKHLALARQSSPATRQVAHPGRGQRPRDGAEPEGARGRGGANGRIGERQMAFMFPEFLYGPTAQVRASVRRLATRVLSAN